MTRFIWSALTAVVIIAAAPPTAAAGSGRPHEPSEPTTWGWVIVSGGNTSASDMRDLESIDDLQRRFGQDFLLFRDGHDRYVIRDPELIARALRATHALKVYGKEIRLLARFQTEGARATAKNARKVAAARQREREDARARPDDDDAHARLEREIDDLNREIDALRTDPAADSRASQDLERRSEALSKRLDRAVEEAQKEMRDILRDAKAHHLAQQVN